MRGLGIMVALALVAPAAIVGASAVTMNVSSGGMLSAGMSTAEVPVGAHEDVVAVPLGWCPGRDGPWWHRYWHMQNAQWQESGGFYGPQPFNMVNVNITEPLDLRLYLHMVDWMTAAGGESGGHTPALPSVRIDAEVVSYPSYEGWPERDSGTVVSSGSSIFDLHPASTNAEPVAGEMGLFGVELELMGEGAIPEGAAWALEVSVVPMGDCVAASVIAMHTSNAYHGTLDGLPSALSVDVADLPGPEGDAITAFLAAIDGTGSITGTYMEVSGPEGPVPLDVQSFVLEHCHCGGRHYLREATLGLQATPGEPWPPGAYVVTITATDRWNQTVTETGHFTIADSTNQHAPMPMLLPILALAAIVLWRRRP